jgi:hypothetical protein
VSDFPTDYKLLMIRAYPTIAQMDADEEYFATAEERDEAFGRILANRNLRRTHEMYLEDRKATAAQVGDEQ